MNEQETLRKVLSYVSYGLYIVSSCGTAPPAPEQRATDSSSVGRYAARPQVSEAMPTTDGEKPNGQIVNSVFQVTADPPKIAISLNKNNLTHSYVEKSKIFSISVLDQETPMTFIGLFGFRCGRDVDKFEKTAHKMREKCPIVTDNTLAVMLCKVSASMDLGTHTLFIGEVIGSELIKEGTPLTYDYYHKVKKGKTQKYATTYNEG